jgi:hypothetical protein
MCKAESRPIATEGSGNGNGLIEVTRQQALVKAGTLQNAIFNSANFSSIATDEKGIIQIKSLRRTFPIGRK